jgi:hypothetical protein
MLYDKKNFFINRFMHQSSAVSGIIEHLVFRHKHSYQTAAGMHTYPFGSKTSKENDHGKKKKPAFQLVMVIYNYNGHQ